MKTEIPIGQTGEIDGVEVQAVVPENHIYLCHGCHFVDVRRNDTCRANNPICRQPDRIFKRIEKPQITQIARIKYFLFSNFLF